MPSLYTMPDQFPSISYQDMGSTSETWSQGSYTSRRIRSPEQSSWESPPSPSRLSQ